MVYVSWLHLHQCLCRTHPDHVVYGVDVGVSHVHSDGPQGEAILLAHSVDDDGGFGVAHGRRQVSARGRVP